MALAWKYRVLVALRRARARGEALPERAVFVSLAQRFPGALRELDTLVLSEMEARAEALERAAVEPDAFEPWMGWLHDYHAWMRAALAVRARLGRRCVVDDERAVRLAEEVGRAMGVPVDSSFVQAVMDPPGGRMVPVVLARVAGVHGTDVEAVRAVLFPPRVGVRAE